MNRTQYIGKVQAVKTEILKSEATATANIGDQVLFVNAPGLFAQEGGVVIINAEEVHYTAIDLELKTMTLAAPLEMEVVEEEPIYLHPIAVNKEAMVQNEYGDDAVWVRVPHALKPMLQDGIRDTPEMETVVYGQENNDGDFVIQDIVTQGAQVHGEHIAELEELFNVTLPQLEADVAALNAIDLQQLQDDLDLLELDVTAAEADILELNTVTIPGLQGELDSLDVTLDDAVLDLTTLNSKFPITTTDIQDGTIQTGDMTANTINGDRITANTLNADRIIAGSIATDRMTANTINGDRITANTLNADKIIAGSITTDLMTANSINGDRITGGTINGDKIIANTINGDRIIANTISGDRVIANTLDAGAIVAGSITAREMSLDALTVGMITGDLINGLSIANPAITMSPNIIFNQTQGLQVQQRVGGVVTSTFSVPGDGTMPSITADIIANTLTVSGGGSIAGLNYVSGSFILQGGIVDPTIGPSITSDQPSLITGMEGLGVATRGLLADATHFVTVGTYAAGSFYKIDRNDGTLTTIAIPGTYTTLDGGIAGPDTSNIWGFQRNAGSGTGRLMKYNAALSAVSATYTATSNLGAGAPAVLGWDSAGLTPAGAGMLMIASTHTTNGTLYVQFYNPTTGAFTGYTALSVYAGHSSGWTVPAGLTVTSVTGITADFGAARMVVGLSDGTYKTFEVSFVVGSGGSCKMVYANQDWSNVDGSSNGVVYDTINGCFYTLSSTERVYRHSTRTAAWNAYAAYQWEDNNAGGTGTHNTAASPTTGPISIPARRYMRVSCSPAPEVSSSSLDAANRIRVFANANSSTIYSQSLLAVGVTTTDLMDTFTNSFTPPANSGWPVSNAYVKSAATRTYGAEADVPKVYLAGDGSHTGITPVGSITMYSAATPPEGWLICDGTAVSRSIYSRLFSVIGTTFGSGDGSTTFHLPNLKGRFPFGAGTGHALGDNESGSGSAGSEAGRRAWHQHTLGNHTHNMKSHTHGVNFPTGATGNTSNVTQGSGTTSSRPTAGHVHAVTGNTGGPSDNTSDWPNNNWSDNATLNFLGLHFIIRYI